MTELSALWLPVLASAVLVFIVSAIVHMAPLWHKNDFPRVPDEDRVLDALRAFQVPPGDYMIPRASSGAEMRSEAYREKVRRGPVWIVTVLPAGGPSMGRQLALWFAYLVVIGVFAAYVAGRTLPPGADYKEVFRYVGTVTFLAQSAALWSQSIWFYRAWSHTAKETLDGLIYALVAAGVFGALWP